jgi:outer membrane lipoprotein SlyB
MNISRYAVIVIAAALTSGCADMRPVRYGETATPAPINERVQDRYGRIARVEIVQVDDDYRFGVGTAVGAVAGGIIGSNIGGGSGNTLATVLGAVAGGVAGTAIESKTRKQQAQQVTVDMDTGGRLVITQPIDSRLRSGMRARVEGSGDTARVVPR